jgi:hypothetical protein
MDTDTSRGTFEDVIQGSSTEMAAIANRLRELFSRLDPDVVEVPRPAEQHVEYGVGLIQANQIFGYICPMQKYVRLGFYYGASLPDPSRLLEGSGKRLRHIKIYTLSEAGRPEIQKLLEAAFHEREDALRSSR